MDPQQRRFLQIAYQCFEDAGYAGSRIKNSNTGVYISAAMTNYSEGLAEFTPLSVQEIFLLLRLQEFLIFLI